MTTDMKCAYVTAMRIRQKMELTNKKMQNLSVLYNGYKEQYENLKNQLEKNNVFI